jgi:hypothetical protein
LRIRIFDPCEISTHEKMSIAHGVQACEVEKADGHKVPSETAAGMGANGRCNGGIPSVDSAERRGSAPPPASRAEAAALRAG